MVINQGDVYWVDLGDPAGSSPGYLRPFLIIQNNIFNKSKINTVIVCALTSNLARAKSPGNVLLDDGEADLPKQSVINISQLFTIDKSDLQEYIGSVSAARIAQILEGLHLITDPRDI